jgi:AcrR family transcriptional regulator
MRDIHPTKSHLIETAVALINEHGPHNFTVDQLLDMSKISKGSLYHHFEDFNDVIIAAQVERFALYVEEDIVNITGVVLAATSKDDLLARLDAISVVAHSYERVARRGDRMEILSSARHSEKMKQALGPVQARLTSSFADLIREMQSRLWVTTEISPEAVAVFIQAYSLGLVVNDASSEHIDMAAWHQLMSRVLRTLI